MGSEMCIRDSGYWSLAGKFLQVLFCRPEHRTVGASSGPKVTCTLAQRFTVNASLRIHKRGAGRARQQVRRGYAWFRDHTDSRVKIPALTASENVCSALRPGIRPLKTLQARGITPVPVWQRCSSSGADTATGKDSNETSKKFLKNFSMKNFKVHNSRVHLAAPQPSNRRPRWVADRLVGGSHSETGLSGAPETLPISDMRQMLGSDVSSNEVSGAPMETLADSWPPDKSGDGDYARDPSPASPGTLRAQEPDCNTPAWSVAAPYSSCGEVLPHLGAHGYGINDTEVLPDPETLHTPPVLSLIHI